MATIKSHTDLPQSKTLSKILPLESADSHYVRKSTDFMGKPVNGKWSEPKYGNINSKYAHYVVQNFSRYEKLPCWSLAALLDILPTIDDEFEPQLHRSSDKYLCTYEGKEDSSGLWKVANNSVDACVAMIEKLHELKML